jgi:hypothetical protein
MTASIWEPGSILAVNPSDTVVPEAFVAVAGQTLFTLTQFTYSLNAGALLVFVNGVYQKSGTDYAETSTSSITFDAALQDGDVVVIIGLVAITGTGSQVISAAMIPVFTAASIALARAALNVPAVGDDIPVGSTVTDGQLVMTSGYLLGRTTAGDGAVQNITVGNGLSLSSGTLALSNPHQFQDFRLSLSSGNPVTTADQTAKTVIYATPYLGNNIALYIGGIWKLHSSAEVSIAIPAAANTAYDVFAYSNGGNVALYLEAWTNPTTRANALGYTNGVLTSGLSIQYRYLGTFCTTAVAGQTEDSYLNRLLWNYYNRIDRPLKVIDTTNSWNYTTATWRQANGSTNNGFSYVQGVSEEPIEAEVLATVSNTNAGVLALTGIGIDSTTVNSTDLIVGATCPAVNSRFLAPAKYRGYPGIGKHTVNWLEYSAAAGTTTWYGDDGGTTVQSGMLGKIKG